MSEDLATKFWPTELRVNSDDRMLEIDFDNGESFSIAAELLRVESPSAEVQGHGKDQKTTIAGRRHVSIIGVEPVGNYAVRLRFDDLHDTGLFSWRYLYELGSEQDRLWEGYLGRLEEQGLSRDP
jgi:DUF971 family protein